MAFTEAQLCGELVNTLARIDEADHSGLDSAISRAMGDESPGRRGEQPGHIANVRAGAEVFTGVQAELNQTDAAVQQLLQRYAECRPTRTR